MESGQSKKTASATVSKEDVLITVETEPLDADQKDSICSLLARAFRKDTLMTEMLGASKWQRIVYPYFRAQIDLQDIFLTATYHGKRIGALTARSPAYVPSADTNLKALLNLVWYLNRHYSESHELAQRIGSEMPRNRHWYLNQIAVEPDYQTFGVGSLLLDELVAMTSDDIYVDCEPSLNPFYEVRGFQRVNQFTTPSLSILARCL